MQDIDAADSAQAGWLGPWLKGFPALEPPLPLAKVAQRGWSLRGDELPLPLAVLRQRALDHNIGWMQAFAQRHGVQMAPHGKTTMSPQLFARQLQAGAWGLTFANVHQLRLGLAAGARRALIANQLVSRADVAELLDLRRRHAGLEVAFFVDSLAQLDLLAEHWQQIGAAGEPRLDVLLELGSLRCGLREHGAALDVARRLRTHPALRLRGLAFYEGLQVQGKSAPDRALMARWQARVEPLLADIEAEQLIEPDARPLWLSGGGSALFDLVAPVLAGPEPGVADAAGRPLRVGLLRSGCYVCHDRDHYRRLVEPIDQRLGSAGSLLGAVDGHSLIPALEVWCEVLSCPEPGLALLNAGRRDLSFDQGWPLPVWHLGRGPGAARRAAPAGWSIAGLNDQHAYLRWDAAIDAGPAVGDRLALGPSHPCTTFDKWAWMAVLDDDDRVIDAITTRFS